MRKHKNEILLILGILIGLSVLLYPSFSNYVNQIGASYAVKNYDNALDVTSAEQFAAMRADAQAYNEQLASQVSQYQDGEPKDAYYTSLLNLNGDGMMGYITIKKLGVLLPIYHGTADEILASSTGHLEGSSLPIGGESTHAVITGHRGLPTAKLFTNLDKLQIGDTFTITVLDEILTYQVDRIDTVLPDQTDLLDIVPGEDLVSLVTCTPYAVNTHRLLVRAHRIPTVDEKRVPADAEQFDPVLTACCIAAPFLLAAAVKYFGRKKAVKESLEQDRSRKNGNTTERKPDDQE